MRAAIKRVVLGLFPELTAGYHLPMFAQVVAARETPTDGDLSDDFRPRFAVDLQPLNEQLEPATDMPVLPDVPLPAPMAGHESGVFGYPKDGTIVELAFAYGSPNRPFIRTVLALNLALPGVDRDAQRWQHSPDNYQMADQNGNWSRSTAGSITDSSLTRLVEAMQAVEAYETRDINTKTNDTEIIGAIKTIKAYGAMVLQSGGVLNIGALKHLQMTSKTKFMAKAPKNWLGNESDNALQLLSDLMQQVIDLTAVLDSHTHPSVGAINEGAAVTAVGSATSATKTTLDNLTE